VSVAAIAMITSRDVWAGGSQSCCDCAHSDYLAHRTGARWRSVGAVVPDDVEKDINDVAAISSHDIWAVGDAVERAETAHYTCRT
jgi:hypothetical protein